MKKLEIKYAPTVKGEDNYSFYSDKKAIVLHHSMAKDTKALLKMWNQTPNNLGSAYIIDVDGTITRYYAPELFGKHLLDEQNLQVQKSSIGVALILKDDFTKAQLVNLKLLLKMLVEEFEITVQDDFSTFAKYDKDMVRDIKPGIWAHSTIDNKADDIKPTKEVIKALSEAFPSYPIHK